MDLGLDSSTAFYTLGVIFGIFTIIYFGIEVILEISPVAKSAILLLSSAVFFSATGLTASKWRNIPLYFMASFSYLIFVAYTLVKFQFGSVGTFLMLAGSSTVFFGAGYMVSEKDVEVPRDKARYLVIAGVLLIAALFIFDSIGSEAQVNLQLRNDVNMTYGSETALGSVHVSNSFVLPRSYELPNYGACLPESDRSISLYVEDGKDLVYKGQDVEMELKARYYPEIERRNGTNKTWKTYSVVKTDECVRKEGQISVFEREYD
ncbi:MAG: hypothetical protein ABEK04_00995 [Candidatus Nanohalobium sp.]